MYIYIYIYICICICICVSEVSKTADKMDKKLLPGNSILSCFIQSMFVYILKPICTCVTAVILSLEHLWVHELPAMVVVAPDGYSK